MATRTIVTSQPDVECEVCARRLLRGEQPDVFLVAGRRRIVCELCAPRAAHAGWQRETDGQSLTLTPMRPRRGRGLFERLPAAFRARQAASAAPSAAADAGELAAPSYDDAAIEASYAGAPFDRLGPQSPAAAAPTAPTAPAHEQPTADHPAADHPAAQQLADGARTHAPPAPPAAQSETLDPPQPASEYVQQALAVFNAGAFPRRVAGVARSLGAPEVSARSAEHLASVVVIVVAWELCWYRYEVDLSEGAGEAQLTAQGTELAQLAREDRLANALAADSGQLALVA